MENRNGIRSQTQHRETKRQGIGTQLNNYSTASLLLWGIADIVNYSRLRSISSKPKIYALVGCQLVSSINSRGLAVAIREKLISIVYNSIMSNLEKIFTAIVDVSVHLWLYYGLENTILCKNVKLNVPKLSTLCQVVRM
jgi:hypothetical protein